MKNHSAILLCAAAMISAACCGNRQGRNVENVQEEPVPYVTHLYATHDTSALYLDIYRPVKDSVTADGIRKPYILNVFGGGFYEGDKRDSYNWFQTLAKNGYGVIAIDYRLGLKGVHDVGINTFVEAFGKAVRLAVDDLFSATEFVLANSASLGIDPRSIVVSGQSAGAITALQAEYELANRSAVAATLPSDFNYAGVMAFAGAVLLFDRPLSYAEKPCPTMLLHGTEDDIVTYTKIMVGDCGFYGSDSIAKVFADNDYEYKIYRYLHNNHSVAGFNTVTLDNQLRFLEKNVIGHARENVDALIDDPSLPHYPSVPNAYGIDFEKL